MKTVVAIALTLATAGTASAQMHNVFADVGINDLSFNSSPVVSVTYNYKLSRLFGIGGGVQTAYYPYYSTPHQHMYQYRPTLFADLRRYIPVRRSLFFGMLDIGLDMYHSSGGPGEGAHNDGLGVSLGAGYCYRVTRRGSGPYVTLKMVSDTYSAPQYAPYLNKPQNTTYLDAVLVFAAGFKF